MVEEQVNLLEQTGIERTGVQRDLVIRRQTARNPVICFCLKNNKTVSHAILPQTCG